MRKRGRAAGVGASSIYDVAALELRSLPSSPVPTICPPRSTIPPIAVPSAQPAASSSVTPYAGARRGSLAIALRTASTDDDLMATIEAFQRDQYAASSVQSRASWLKTWKGMHAAAFRQRTLMRWRFSMLLSFIVGGLVVAAGYPKVMGCSPDIDELVAKAVARAQVPNARTKPHCPHRHACRSFDTICLHAGWRK